MLSISSDAWEVHGSGPLLSNLCKSIAIDEDDEAMLKSQPLTSILGGLQVVRTMRMAKLSTSPSGRRSRASVLDSKTLIVRLQVF